MSDFGIRVGYPTHDAVFRVQSIRPRHQCIQRSVFRLGVSCMCELKRRADVARRENTFVARSVMFVDRDAATMIFNTSRFQVQALSLIHI